MPRSLSPSMTSWKALPAVTIPRRDGRSEPNATRSMELRRVNACTRGSLFRTMRWSCAVTASISTRILTSLRAVRAVSSTGANWSSENSMSWVQSEVELLAAPDRGHREILVQPRLEDDVRGLQAVSDLQKLVVDRAQRRPPIAGDVAGRPQSALFVERPLQQGHSRQRLFASDEDGA